jgi:hypothetical protein
LNREIPYPQSEEMKTELSVAKPQTIKLFKIQFRNVEPPTA